MPKQIISASEMERYGYCPLSWHLDLKGIDAEGDEAVSYTHLTLPTKA